MNKRILVVGYGRAGKDTAAFMLEKITHLPYAGSTSWSAKELVAKKLGMHPQVAWETRHKNRELWKSICDDLRKLDQTLLIRLALASVNEDNGLYAGWSGIVTGVRDRAELFEAKMKRIFHHIIWIDRPGVPVDPTVTFKDSNCDSHVVNDGTLDQLQSGLLIWAEERGLVPSLYLRGKCSTTDTYRE